MAVIAPLSLISPSVPFHFHSLSSRKFTFVPKFPFENLKGSVNVLFCSSPRIPPTTEEDVIKFVAESDEKILPCVRTYENDLSQLSLVGAVGFDQALTAAAADGGKAADEHVGTGVPAMVVETVFPGPNDSHATVSTRLFLPARKVKEKANKLRSSISEDILSGTMSSNILAMTFRQVVLQQLWNFELVMFRPGTERQMEDLENAREVPASFTLRSTDERIISVIAEVVCISALQSTEKHFLDTSLGRTSSSFFRWFQKHKRIESKDSSVLLYPLFEDEIVENAKSLLETFDSMKESFNPMQTKPKCHWWMPSTYSKLEKIGGCEFSTWAVEYVPAYRLEIDIDRLKDVNFEGWRKCAENKCDVLLTHSQMVGLADALDMYFEDIYSLPDKHLPCGAVGNYTNLSSKKRGSSLLKVLSVTVASGILLTAVSALGHFFLPHQCKGGMYLGDRPSLLSSKIESVVHRSLDTGEVEACCTLVVKKIKDAFGWPDDIVTERGIGAWIGKVPDYLKVAHEANSSTEDNSANSVDLEKIDEDLKSSLQDVASYQVVLSTDGKIVGLQPTSRVGVNHWAANPLSKELYSGRKLHPGFIEPGLKIRLPDALVVIELLISVNSDSHFVLAKPNQMIRAWRMQPKLVPEPQNFEISNTT